MKNILFAALIPFFALLTQDALGGGFFSRKPTHETRAEYSSSTVQTPTGSQTTSSSRVRTRNRTPQYAPSYYYYAPSSGGGQPNDVSLGKPIGDVLGAVGELGKNAICLFGLLCGASGKIGEAVREATRPTEYFQPEGAK